MRLSEVNQRIRVQALALLSMAAVFSGCYGDGPYVDPVSGPTYGGTEISIFAGGEAEFDEDMRVRVGEAECSPITHVSKEEIRCLTGAHAETEAPVDVVVIDNADYDPVLTVPGTFEYLCSDEGTEGAVVWANEGGDKVVRGRNRATCDPFGLTNSVWDGEKITVFGAKNEVVNFNLIIEAAGRNLDAMTVELDSLSGPSGAELVYTPGNSDTVYDLTNRQIELFYVRYLQIKGLSTTGYDTYDERHVPHRMRRDWDLEGFGTGTWDDRPDADTFYPDIAVPLELENGFDVVAGQNQSVWADVYIPKGSPAGLYTGTVVVSENGSVVKEIPVELTVRDFTLPDVPTAKTMVFMGYGDVNQRYIGVRDPLAGHADGALLDTVRDRHFQMAHRHKLSLIDENNGRTVWNQNAPRPQWQPRLDGSLFSATAGYEGPGQDTGNGIFAIGPWGSWSWKSGTEADMHANTDAWEQWFRDNAPDTQRLLFLDDEPDSGAPQSQVETWAQWIDSNPGEGSALNAFATGSLLDAEAAMPSLDMVATFFQLGITDVWESAVADWKDDGRELMLYNGKRPATGSFVIEDDGIALRQAAWAQYKMGVDRWFYWESTYYNDINVNRGLNDLFNQAQTLGLNSSVHESAGETGYLYSNGAGVLFYPGTDEMFPSDSYGLNGPIASLRMKHWRRGIQDADYLAMAAAADPAATQAIVDRMVPKTLWEIGVSDPDDPTWVRTDISWPVDPDQWEQARRDLADIIEGN